MECGIAPMRRRRRPCARACVRLSLVLLAAPALPETIESAVVDAHGRTEAPLRVLHTSSAPTEHEPFATYEAYSGALSREQIDGYRALYEADELTLLLGNGLLDHDAMLLAGRTQEVLDVHVSHQLHPGGAERPDERPSTRCWIFSAQRCMQLNLERRLSITEGSTLSAACAP